MADKSDELSFRGHKFTVTDECSDVVFSDVILESGTYDGMVYFSLGATFKSGTQPLQAKVVSRHRMSIITAQILRDYLTRTIDKATKKSESNELN